MSRPKKQKSLHDKLVEVCDAVGPIAKNGKHPKYRFREASDVALAFRGELFKRGVLLIPNELECSQTKHQTNGGVTVITDVLLKTEFILTDGREEKRYNAFGEAQDEEDKALYKAKTGSWKNFLCTLGLIPDDTTNPEFTKTVEDAPVAGETTAAKPRRKKEQHAVRPFEATGFLEACEKNGHAPAERDAYLSKEWGIGSIAQLQRKDFKAALKWAMRKPDSGGRAEASQPHSSQAQPTAMTPPDKPLTTVEANDKIVGALIEQGGYLEPLGKKPQPVVAIMDEIPEFRLRGY